MMISLNFETRVEVKDQNKIYQSNRKCRSKWKRKIKIRLMHGEVRKSSTEKTTEKEQAAGKEKDDQETPLPIMALNHVSRLYRNVKESIDFYTKILGFILIERPQAFDFDGACLFNYEVGIHLLQSIDHEDRLPNDQPDHHDHLDPMDNHISFQCANMEEMEQKLKDLDIKYVKRSVEDEENETAIDQLFFNNLDGFMIEICNCENLKLVPTAGSLCKIKLPLIGTICLSKWKTSI